MSAFALIKSGHCLLAVPQAHVECIETIGDFFDAPTEAFTPIQRGDRSWQAISCDAELQPMPTLNKRHRLAVCFKHYPVAITCEQVTALTHGDFVALPRVMRSDTTCVRGLLFQHHQWIVLVDSHVLCNRLVDASPMPIVGPNTPPREAPITFI